MNRYDHLVRGTACKDSFRFFAVDCTAVVQNALDKHHLAPAPALLLGRLLTAGLLMGAELKDEESSLTINIEAEGPLRGAIIFYEQHGKIKGYAKQPDYFAPVTKDNWLIGQLLGKGTLTVIRDLKLKSPMHGTTELTTGEVGDDIVSYYLLSEQVPTAISLGVLFDPAGKIRSAGGYLIQQMPFTTPDDAENLKDNLLQTPYITDLLDMNAELDTILSSYIFKGMDWTKHETYGVDYYCNCSKERFADALRLLNRVELEDMICGISPVCHYCSKEYDFTTDDIQSIIQSL